MNIFDGVGSLGQMLGYHLERHGVLSANLSNAETPGYAPHDLVFEDTLQQVHAGLQKTDSKHLTQSPSSSQSGHEIVVEQEPTGVDQNGVRLERAMARISANRLRYEGTLEVTRRRLAMLRYASSDGSTS